MLSLLFHFTTEVQIITADYNIKPSPIIVKIKNERIKKTGNLPAYRFSRDTSVKTENPVQNNDFLQARLLHNYWDDLHNSHFDCFTIYFIISFICNIIFTGFSCIRTIDVLTAAINSHRTCR
jgi:hypothetical protein